MGSSEYIVYMLRCSDDSLYTGITNDLERRFHEHNAGIDINCYTFRRRPLMLVYQASFQEVIDAISWEKRLKRWTRKKKEALIRGDYEGIQVLAKRYTPYKKRKRVMVQRVILRRKPQSG